VLAKSCVFGKQLIFTLLCTPKGLLLANLQRYFAEFLKDYSAITLAYSAHPLLLVLVLYLVLHYFLPLAWVLRELPINFGLSLRLRGSINPTSFII